MKQIENEEDVLLYNCLNNLPQDNLTFSDVEEVLAYYIPVAKVWGVWVIKLNDGTYGWIGWIGYGFPTIISRVSFNSWELALDDFANFNKPPNGDNPVYRILLEKLHRR